MSTLARSAWSLCLSVHCCLRLEVRRTIRLVPERPSLAITGGTCAWRGSLRRQPAGILAAPPAALRSRIRLISYSGFDRTPDSYTVLRRVHVPLTISRSAQHAASTRGVQRVHDLLNRRSRPGAFCASHRLRPADWRLHAKSRPGTRDHVRLPCQNHLTRSERYWKVRQLAISLRKGFRISR